MGEPILRLVEDPSCLKEYGQQDGMACTPADEIHDALRTGVLMAGDDVLTSVLLFE